jgi:hypothetical protein
MDYIYTPILARSCMVHVIHHTLSNTALSYKALSCGSGFQTEICKCISPCSKGSMLPGSSASCLDTSCVHPTHVLQLLNRKYSIIDVLYIGHVWILWVFKIWLLEAGRASNESVFVPVSRI